MLQAYVTPLPLALVAAVHTTCLLALIAVFRAPACSPGTHWRRFGLWHSSALGDGKIGPPQSWAVVSLEEQSCTHGNLPSAGELLSLCSDLDSFIMDGFPLSIRYRRSLYYSIYWSVARHPFTEGNSLGRPVLRDLHLGLARSAERDPGARLSHNMVSKPIYFYTYYSTYSRFILAIRGRPCVEPE